MLSIADRLAIIDARHALAALYAAKNPSKVAEVLRACRGLIAGSTV